MELERKIKIISDKLAYLAFLIESRAGLKMYDIHIISESFYAELFNLIFGCNLTNLNLSEPNAKAIDLIDTTNKLIVQVSSDNTKQKVQSSLDGIDTSKYAGFRFLFISISKDVSHLRKNTFNTPEEVTFNPNDDCYDRTSLVNHIVKKGIECIERVCDYLNRTVIETDVKKAEKVFPFSIPVGLLPRDKEVEKLYNKIINNRFLNLIGVGGSGKSSLTYLMMQKHKDDFNEIAYVVVNGNIGIKESIVSQLNETLKLEFEKDDDAYKKIVLYLDDNFEKEKPNLLVVDINELSDEIKDFTTNIGKLCPKKWKMLIVSREYIDPSENIEKEYFNSNQDFVFLKDLFLKRAGERYVNFENFNGLFDTIFHNPLLAEQLGFYLSKISGIKTLEEINSILKGPKFKSTNLKGTAVQTNDTCSTIIDFLRNLILFDTDNFDTNEKKLLCHFVLWPDDFINYGVIKKLLEGVFEPEVDLEVDILSKLSDRAIFMKKIVEDGSYAYKLHGLLAESLREQGIISKTDYSVYLQNIGRIVKYGYYEFMPFANCIGRSLCYDITDNCDVLLIVGGILDYSWKPNYAKILIEKSIDLVKNKPQNQDNMLFLAWAYNSLASLQKDRLADYVASEENFQKAIDTVKNFSYKVEFLQLLSTVFYNLANLQKDNTKEYELAENNYNKSINIRVELAKFSIEDKNELAITYNNLANLQDDVLNNPECAMTNYLNAINIGESLPTNISHFQDYLALAYNNLACLQEKRLNDKDSAQINYVKAIKIRERLRNNAPNPARLDALAAAYRNLAGLLHTKFNDYDQAKNNYCKAIEIWEKLSEEIPMYRYRLTETYYFFAEMLIAFGDYEEAKDNCNKAVQLWNKYPMPKMI